eukprot:gene24120-9695_t
MSGPRQEATALKAKDITQQNRILTQGKPAPHQVPWGPQPNPYPVMLRFLLFAAFLALAQLAPISAQNPSTASKYCFIIRTYFGHGESHSGSLKRLLQNLIDPANEPKKGGAWVKGYHTKLYDLTDEAIRACPRSAEWVIVTNGDNAYDLKFLAEMATVPDAADVVAFDFYSRYQRPTDAADAVAFDFYSRYQRPTANPYDRLATGPGLPNCKRKGMLSRPDPCDRLASESGLPNCKRHEMLTSPWPSSPVANPCDRLAAEPGMPNCKHNGMSFCQTDLAANAMRLKKMITEDRRFGPLDKEGGSSANDGMMASLLRDEGWNVHHVDGGKCLVSHSPNPQHCAIKGTSVWDESVMFNSESFGGECITVDQASKKLAIHPDLYEIIAVNISYDPNSFSFGAAMPPNSVFQLQCLRHKGKEYWQQSAGCPTSKVSNSELDPELDTLDVVWSAGCPTSKVSNSELDPELDTLDVVWSAGCPASRVSNSGSSSELDTLDID